MRATNEHVAAPSSLYGRLLAADKPLRRFKWAEWFQRRRNKEFD